MGRRPESQLPAQTSAAPGESVSPSEPLSWDWGAQRRRRPTSRSALGPWGSCSASPAFCGVQARDLGATFFSTPAAPLPFWAPKPEARLPAASFQASLQTPLLHSLISFSSRSPLPAGRLGCDLFSLEHWGGSKGWNTILQASVLVQVPDSPTGLEGLSTTRTPLRDRCIILLGYLGWVTCLLGD